MRQLCNKYLKIALAAISISIVINGCDSNIEIIESNLKDNNYIKAAKKADRLIDENEKKEAQRLIEEKINEIKNRYMSGEIDGTLAISDIVKLRGNNKEVNKYIDSVSEEIHMDMNFKKAFDNGVRFEEEGNYKEALESYNMVNEDDAENYEESRKRINNIKEILIKEEVLSICEEKLIVTSSENKDIYPNQMQVIVKNNGIRNIRKFEVTIFAYDEKNDPVKIENKNMESGNYLFLGLADNININPGDKWGYDYGWSVTNQNINRIEACVEYVEYDDGEILDNPIYIEWLKEHWIDD